MQMAPAKKSARKGGRPSTKASRPIRYADLPEMEWIAIVRDEIVAHAPTLKELGAIVERRADHNIVVFSRVFPRGPQAW
jgi:hypothetical protein